MKNNWTFLLPMLIPMVVMFSTSCKKEVILDYENVVIITEQPNNQGTALTLNLAADMIENQIVDLHPKGMGDLASSVNFDLAPGLVVYLYENTSGTGKQKKLEGKGTLNLADFDMDNLVSAVSFKVE